MQLFPAKEIGKLIASHPQCGCSGCEDGNQGSQMEVGSTAVVLDSLGALLFHVASKLTL